MAKLPPPKREPPPVTYRDVPASLGKGRVSLYDSAVALPSLLESPLPAKLKTKPWVLVHFPSRRHVLVKSKAVGLDYLREIHGGKDSTGVVPKKDGEKRAKPEKSKQPVPAQGRARAKKPAVVAEVKKEQPATPPAPEQKDEAGDDAETTPVPAGATFDQAMQLVFPAGRLTAELERLLRFRKKIFTKDGDELGEEDEPFVQLNAAKLIITYHQGRPAEKEKPPPEKKRVSYDELKTLVLTSDAALEYMERLVQSARAARTDATNPAPPLKPS